MSDLRALEYATLRVPYENLNRNFRTAQKTVDREVSHVQQACTAVDKALKQSTVQISELQPAVKALISRLNTLKDKCSAAVAQEKANSECIQKRLLHIQTAVDPAASPTTLNQWRNERVDRLLVDYLLRSGYYGTAEQLCETQQITGLCNLDVYAQARDIVQALQHHNTQPCLAWCHENKSKLRRLLSRLELLVREQDFIELIRADKKLPAVMYAKKYFSPIDSKLWQAADVQRVMGLLAYTKGDTSVYRDLMDDKRWQLLANEFWTEFYRVYQLPRWSTFSAVLQTGLSSLKTPQCSPLNAPTSSCPLCRPDVHNLASGLPYAHASNSRLICNVSQQPMNENNPAMMLPNGQVYGSQTLETMAWHNDGVIECPRTNEKYSLEQALRVYVM